MADTDSLLKRWRTAGVLDAEAEARIRAFEVCQRQPAGLRWQGMIALILGAILLACGVALFVNAHWDELGAGARYTIVIAVVCLFHLAGGLAREKFLGLSTTLQAVGTIATGAAIALVGQIFNIQEHWPAAVLLWGLAAAAGWILLRDQAQQTLTLLLIPAWMASELALQMDGHIGQGAYLGRVLFVWAILYLTFFLSSQRKILRAILFTAGAIAAVGGTVDMLQNWRGGWLFSSSLQTFAPFGTRAWAWVAIAAVPLVVAAFHGHKGLVPIALAVAYAIALPFCQHTWTQYAGPNGPAHTLSEPNLAAHALAVLFAVFLCWWGVRMASRALVNFAVAGFALAVAWFYYSDIYSKVGKSIGLIGLGILFLAGGWLLERTRRRLVANLAVEEAK